MYRQVVYHVRNHMKANKKVRKRVAIWSILLLQATGFFYDNVSYWWSYPLKQVTSPTGTCKQQDRDQLSNDCKISLPVIAKADYETYKTNQLYRLVYSTLWGGTYNDWWDITLGAHEWVDLVSSQWTPVYAIADGDVIRARSAAWYGNLVTIRHKLTTGKYVESVYGHLSKILVKEGTKVKEWTQIGAVGHEGGAQGNHLHFAINTTQDYTYTFRGCLDYPKTSDYDIVQKWLCRDLLFARTVDPIAFIENGWLTPALAVPTVSTIITKNLAASTVTTAPTTPKPTAVTPKKTVVTTAPVKPAATVAIKATSSISSASLKTDDSFLKKWTISAVSNFGTTLKQWSSSTIGVILTDKAGKAFAGTLDKEIAVTPSNMNVSLSPRIIRYVSDGKVIVIIEAKTAWTAELVVTYGKQVLGKLSVTVQ